VECTRHTSLFPRDPPPPTHTHTLAWGYRNPVLLSFSVYKDIVGTNSTTPHIHKCGNIIKTEKKKKEGLL
jgi:hypothetical protein